MKECSGNHDLEWEIAPAADIAESNWSREVAMTASGNEADARLIAAAPDLLEAAKLAHEALRAYQEHLNVGQFNSVEDKDAIDYLAEAIAKAEAV